MKKIFAAIAAVVVTVLTLAPANVANAAASIGAASGQLVLMASNKTTGSAWAYSASAKPGDVIAYKIAYQNTGTEVLKNVTIRLDVSKYILGTYGSTLGATAYVAGNVANGDQHMTQGSVDFNMNSGSSVEAINLISDSLKWYTGANADVLTAIPQNQDGSRLLNGGLNLGDVQPGAMGQVTIRMQITNTQAQPVVTPAVAPVATALTYSISAANGQLLVMTSNKTTNSAWSLTASAKPGDVIAYKIAYQNTGTGVLKNVHVRLDMPKYILGTNGSAIGIKGYAVGYSANNEQRVASSNADLYMTAGSTAEAINVVADSLKWYTGANADVLAAIPQNQNGNNVFNTEGLYLGDVQPGAMGQVTVRMQITDTQVKSAATVAASASTAINTSSSSSASSSSGATNSSNATGGNTYFIDQSTTTVRDSYNKVTIVGTTGSAGVVDNSNVVAGRPIVSTLSAINIGSTSATLRGSVNPNNSTTECQFEYGTSTALGITTPYRLINTTNPICEETIFGLAPNTTYFYRAVARNSYGTVKGDIMPPFVTANGYNGTGTDKPTFVSTEVVNNFGEAATLKAALCSNGSDTTVWFEWGTTQNFGSATEKQLVAVTQACPVVVAKNITGLVKGKTYWYQAVAENGRGPQGSTPKSFVAGGTSTANATATTGNQDMSDVMKSLTKIGNGLANITASLAKKVANQTSNFYDTIQTTVSDAVDPINFSLSVEPQKVTAGKTATIKADVFSTANVVNAQLRLTLDPKLTISKNNAVSFSQQGNTVTMFPGTIAANNLQKYEIEVVVDQKAVKGDVLEISGLFSYSLTGSDKKNDVVAGTSLTVDQSAGLLANISSYFGSFGGSFFPLLLALLIALCIILLGRKIIQIISN